jgi:hypothetical protein
MPHFCQWQESAVTGSVRCFFPAARRGIIQTENGERLPFAVSGDSPDLQGGDIVMFEQVGGRADGVSQIRLHRKWVELLDEQHRSLVNQFHQTVEIRS